MAISRGPEQWSILRVQVTATVEEIVQAAVPAAALPAQQSIRKMEKNAYDYFEKTLKTFNYSQLAREIINITQMKTNKKKSHSNRISTRRQYLKFNNNAVEKKINDNIIKIFCQVILALLI